MIKNILLDLDDTLFDFKLAEKVALTKTLIHLGIEPTEEVLARYSYLNDAQWKLLEEGKLTREEVKVRRYQLLFDEIGKDCSPYSATVYYEGQLGIGHYFMEGAEELLKALHGVYRLYLASNGCASVQKGRIESAGIAKYFDDIFISQAIGYDKPSINFFKSCFSKIPDFKKHETLIVGDRLSSDIRGGLEAGITTVWYNPEREINNTDIVPHYEIGSLMDLIPLLKSIACRT